MKLYQFRVLKRLLLACVVLLGVLIIRLFTLPNEKMFLPSEPKITVVSDTVWQTKWDTFNIENTVYETAYISRSKSKNDLVVTVENNNTKPLKHYKDTLENRDLTIYSNQLVDGLRLDAGLTYKLKVPREVVTTKTIEYPKQYQSGLFLFTEVGGHTAGLENVKLGVLFSNKTDWFVSYGYNMMASPNTHHIGVGKRIF